MNAVVSRKFRPMTMTAQLFKRLSLGMILKSKAAQMLPKRRARMAIPQIISTSNPILPRKSVSEH